MSNVIGDLKVNINALLTDRDKKVLMDIIEKEFNNKESLYHTVQEQEKEKIVAAYLKEVGFAKLRSEMNKAQLKVESIKGQIQNLGLNEYGCPNSSNSYDRATNSYKQNYSAKKLNDKLESIQKNAPSQTLKSKLITRLQLATTKGEGLIIMKQVLGNNELPDVNPNQITYTE